MLSFVEWISEEKRRKEKRDVSASNQRSAEIGNVHNQGKVTGGDSQIVSNDVHIIPEP